MADGRYQTLITPGRRAVLVLVLALQPGAKDRAPPSTENPNGNRPSQDPAVALVAVDQLLPQTRLPDLVLVHAGCDLGPPVDLSRDLRPWMVHQELVSVRVVTRVHLVLQVCHAHQPVIVAV